MPDDLIEQLKQVSKVLWEQTRSSMEKSGDTYRRRKVSPDAYQCGCRWERSPDYGDVLVECALHQRATEVQYRRFEREMAARGWRPEPVGGP